MDTVPDKTNAADIVVSESNNVLKERERQRKE